VYLSYEQLNYLSRATHLPVTKLFTKGPEVWVDWGRGPRLLATYDGIFRLSRLIIRDLPVIATLIEVKEGWERDEEIGRLAARRAVLCGV
jgi:hypothetical protein